MSEYRPDSWVVLKMNHKGEVLYKVLGGWAGGYVQGSSWRLNSGIERVEKDADTNKLRFIGSSGSVYVVDPDGYGLRMSTAPIYETMTKTFPDQVEMLENQDWTNFEWTTK